METVTQIQVAWELRKAGRRVDAIAAQLGRHRATIYRWLKGIRQRGIRGYIRYFKQAKKGRRVRKTRGYIVQKVLRLRRDYRDCCGEKIVYLLAREGIRLSLSTVYRILKRHLVLRKRRRNYRGEPLQTAHKARQVIQIDTLDLGQIYAYTAIDIFTREAQVIVRPTLQAADGKQALEHIMRYFGSVAVIQTDGGSEFQGECGSAMHRFCDYHRVARPYKKNEQAFIEAFNGTLRREEFGRTPFQAGDVDLAQARADDFLRYYHRQRPHLSLNMLTPAAFAESHLL